MTERHPAVADLLDFFGYAHLPPHLREVSQGFHDLAYALVDDHDLAGPELTVALRKLLEAKDCAVRAALKQGRS